MPQGPACRVHSYTPICRTKSERPSYFHSNRQSSLYRLRWFAASVIFIGLVPHKNNLSGIYRARRWRLGSLAERAQFTLAKNELRCSEPSVRYQTNRFEGRVFLQAGVFQAG